MQVWNIIFSRKVQEPLILLVSLQPFEYDPAEKNKHKFMVQSMFAPDGEINQDTLVGTELDKVVIYILQFSVEGD